MDARFALLYFMSRVNAMDYVAPSLMVLLSPVGGPVENPPSYYGLVDDAPVEQ